MRFHFYKILIAAAFILFQASIATAEFKLYLDDSRTKHIMVEEQDCSVYKSENGKITLGFKAGSLFFGIGPEISFGKDFKKRLTQVLLDMNAPDLLASFPRRSFVPADNSDYEPIENVAKAVGLID